MFLMYVVNSLSDIFIGALFGLASFAVIDFGAQQIVDFILFIIRKIRKDDKNE